MIWNSGNDENGRYSGGEPGDQTDGELESVRGVYEKDGSTMPTYTFSKEGSVDRIMAVLAR